MLKLKLNREIERIIITTAAGERIVISNDKKSAATAVRLNFEADPSISIVRESVLRDGAVYRPIKPSTTEGDSC